MPEEIPIVRTVIKEFLAVADNPVCAEKVFGIVREYVEGNANQATTRCEVRNALTEINQHPDDERLDLCIEPAHALAWGYLKWKQAQDDVNLLLEYPALEFLQLFKRDELVDWTQKWRESGGRVFSGHRMIALNNDPVWTEISFFRLPFPPFDLESGRRAMAVAREEAEELGLLLDAWGDTTKAIEYYECALDKNPKIAVKGRLDILRRRASKAAAGSVSREESRQMDIRFSCTSCGQHVVIGEAGAGMTVQCPNCGASLTAPNSTSTEQARAPAASAPEPALLYTLFRGRGPAKLTQISDAKYFYRKQTVEGPFDKLEMRVLMRKKIVEPETMILCPATHQWQPCERFPELPKPARNKLLHFEKDSRFAALVQEIPRLIVEEIAGKISEADLRNWLARRIQECGYQCPDYDEGTINDLASEDRVGVVVRTNRQTWIGCLRYLQQGGSSLTNKPALIGF
jgi:predicted RNA-binding Zn-ribbon protein involved in translation (DUF1610 family)